jgi:hypothetical protein
MPKLISRTLVVLYFIIACIIPAQAEQVPDLQKFGYEWEEYDSSLFEHFQSIDDIVSYADSILGIKSRQTRMYSELLAATIRKRFYHGYSYYATTDNWLAWLAGKFLWDHLHAIVLPEDIMKHPMAACSQQAIVLKECFRKVGIPYRQVGLVGHFLLEGRVEGDWLLFDTNMEPHFARGRKSLADLMQTNEIYLAYAERLSPERMQRMFAHPVYGQLNNPIAPNATIFQYGTKFLSLAIPYILPLPLLVGVVYRAKQKKSVEMRGRNLPAAFKLAEVSKTVPVSNNNV